MRRKKKPWGKLGGKRLFTKRGTVGGLAQKKAQKIKLCFSLQTRCTFLLDSNSDFRVCWPSSRGGAGRPLATGGGAGAPTQHHMMLQSRGSPWSSTGCVTSSRRCRWCCCPYTISCRQADLGDAADGIRDRRRFLALPNKSSDTLLLKTASHF